MSVPWLDVALSTTTEMCFMMSTSCPLATLWTTGPDGVVSEAAHGECYALQDCSEPGKRREGWW